jgi:hypothetical protein
MQVIRCPFCFVYLDVSHIARGQILQCPGCSKSIRNDDPIRLRGRRQAIAGLILGLGLGALATLAAVRASNPAPAPNLASASSPDAEPVPPPSPAVEPSLLRVEGASANAAAARLRQEFGDGTFSMCEAAPWLVALENGKYDARQAIQLYVRGVQSLYDSFRKEFRALRLPEPKHTLPVVIFNSRESFDNYCRRTRGGSMPRTVTGFYEPSRQRTVTYHEGLLPIERMLHESAHQLVHTYSLPSVRFHSFWFHEGLGGLFETYRRSRQGSFETVDAAPEINHPRLYDALRALNDPDLRSYVTVRQVMSMTMDSFRDWWDGISRQVACEPRRDVAAQLEAERDRIANAWYAVSWALVYFMLRSDAASSDVLMEYFVQETRGRGGRDTFELILKGRNQQDLDQFQEKFLAYLGELK